MNDSPSKGLPPTAEHPTAVRLDSWKEIAAYLRRDVTTVQRWERREGMPVHRHQHDKMGSVFAYPSEIDAWVRSRSLGGAPADAGKHVEQPGTDVAPEVAAEPRAESTAQAPTATPVIGRRGGRWFLAAAQVTFWQRGARPSGQPEINIWGIPLLGGAPHPYLEGIAE
jgi:hypothetical protein